MKYLYGNSAPSPLQSNFLAYLRDAMEFCVHVLLAQERITVLRRELRELEEYAEAERQRIERLRGLVIDVAGTAQTDGPESMSLRAVERVKAASTQAVTTVLSELDGKLAAARAGIAAKDRDERNRCLDSFGQWVAHHEPHEGTWKLSARLVDDGYDGEITGAAPYGIRWKYAIDLEDDHPMAHGSRVGDHVTQIELALPEPGGWLKKGKLKAHRIDDFVIERFESSGGDSAFALRVMTPTPMALEIEVRDDQVTVLVVGAKESLGVEVNEDNRQRLLTLRDRVLDALTSHPKVHRRVSEATIDDLPLCDGEDLGAVASRLINAAAPIVQQIRDHSLSPGELVMRRLLGNDQRVEIFVSTSSLLEKVGRLPRNLRPMFAILGLEWQRAQTPLPIPVMLPPEPEPEEASTTELVAESPPIDSSMSPTASGAIGDSGPVASGSAAAPSPSPSSSAEHSIQIDPRERFGIDARSKESLAATVKRIVGFARQGQTSDAYEAYAALFEDEDFARQRPQDQRQVLKLMMKAPTEKSPTTPILQAYRSALVRLQALASETNDPADQQLFAACKEALDSQQARA